MGYGYESMKQLILSVDGVFENKEVESSIVFYKNPRERLPSIDELPYVVKKMESSNSQNQDAGNNKLKSLLINLQNSWLEIYQLSNNDSEFMGEIADYLRNDLIDNDGRDRKEGKEKRMKLQEFD